MRTGPPTPTQVHAQRFTARRLGAALVGRDPTLRRDPSRTQIRALAVGAVLALLALVAFAVLGAVRGDRDWRAARIVRGDPSGALYVVVHGPDRLVPTPNLASARLLASAADGPGPGDPLATRDDTLAQAPRTAAAGIPDAPSTLPGPDLPAPRVWSVCDAARLDPSVPDPAAAPAHATVVLGTGDPVGRAFGGDEALVLRGPDGTVWLVEDGRRSPLADSQRALARALGLAAARPRAVSGGLLAALPAGPPLIPPVIPGIGTLPTDPTTRALGLAVGAVISPDSVRFFLVLPRGVQEVPAVVAQIVRFSVVDPTADPGIAPVAASTVDELPRTAGVDLAAYPSEFPRVVDYTAAPTVCVRPGDGAASLSAAPGPPVPTMPLGPGAGADAAWVAGAGAHVVAPGRPSVLVDDRARVHPVPDPAALGLPAPTPIPPAVLDLLPRGSTLDVDDARLLR